MSLVRPSFSHIFLKRRSICSAVSLPRLLTLIMRPHFIGYAAKQLTIPTNRSAGKCIRRGELFKLYCCSMLTHVRAIDDPSVLNYASQRESDQAPLLARLWWMG